MRPAQPDDDVFCDAGINCYDPEHEHTVIHEPGGTHDPETLPWWEVMDGA